MATYNNKHWLLSNIRNSFISTDDTGLCETLMLSEDLPSQYTLYSKSQSQEDECISNNSNSLGEFYFYPGLEQSDEEDLDPAGHSYDIQMDQDVGFYRQRSNTAQKLEKMNLAKKRASKIKIIKCDEAIPTLTNAEKNILFEKIVPKSVPIKATSQLRQHLTQNTEHRNKFFQYARFDGVAHINLMTKKMKIFVGMLPPNQRNYPIDVCVISTAKIYEFIGLICYKVSLTNPDLQLLSVDSYGLYITEEDGEIDLEFPPLDQRENVSKFRFSHLTLIERKQSENCIDTRGLHILFDNESSLQQQYTDTSQSVIKQSEDLAKMHGHTTMIEAPLYRSYRVQIVTKGLFKTDIQLGISGEKLEIDPVQQQNSKFWSRQKAISHSMDSIAWCEITCGETVTSNSTIRIVYSVTNEPQKSNTIQTSTNFKHYNFITSTEQAKEIVEKINNIIDVRSSGTRREYLTKHMLNNNENAKGNNGLNNDKRKVMGKLSPKKKTSV